MRFTRKEALVIFAIFVFAFTLRFIYLNQIAANSPFYDPTSTKLDPCMYDQLASRISQGDLLCKKIVYVKPFYPYFLALVYFLLGDGLFISRFIQIMIGSFTCILIYLIAWQLFNRPTALIASVMAAAYGPFIFHEGMLIPTALTIFLYCCLTFALLRAADFPIVPGTMGKKWVGAGVLLGLSILSGASILFFALLLPIWLWGSFKGSSRKKFLVSAMSLYLGAVLVIGANTFRNYLAAKDFVPISAHGGINFYIGSNPNAKGSFNMPILLPLGVQDSVDISIVLAQGASGKRLKPSEVSRFWFIKGLRFIREHPRNFARLLLRKGRLFWQAFEIPDIEDYYFAKRYSKLLQLPLFNFGVAASLGLVGMFLSFKNRKKLLLLYLLLLGHMGATLLFWVHSRYRLPVVPYLIIFAAYAVYWWFQKLRQGSFKPLVLSTAIAAAIFCVVNIKISQHNFGISYYNLGTYHVNRGCYEEAIESLKQALTEDPTITLAHQNLGAAYFVKGRLDEARSEFEKVTEELPDYVHAHFNLGVVLEKMGLHKDAIEEYNYVLKLNPYDEQTKHRLTRLKEGTTSSPHRGED